MIKQTMMVDMDDVICQCRFLKLINEFLGTDYSYDDIGSYYLQSILGDKKDEFWYSIKDINLYEGVELFPDCYDVLKYYSEYLDIYITTAYLWDGIVDISGRNLKDKYEYLKAMLPFIPVENHIYTTNKGLLNFDIRLDDKPSNLTNGELKMMYTEWHNKNIPDSKLEECGIVRVNNWQEVDKVLNKKLCVK